MSTYILGLLKKLTISPSHFSLNFVAYQDQALEEPPDEICDYEIWYNTSKTRVYGTTYRARTILAYYSGLSKRVWLQKDSLIAGFWAVAPLYGTGVFDNLHNEIVIW